jgi:hypothetical protein
MAPVLELDLKAVMFMVLREVAGLSDRVDKDGRQTANRARGHEQVAASDPAQLARDVVQRCTRYVVKHTIETKAQVD